MSYFNEMRLKYKLLAAFFLALAPLMAIGGYVSYAYIERTYRQATLNELKNSADALVKMVETTATVAIRNYLRAVAEKNLEMVQDLYRNHQAGKIGKAQMLAAAHHLFASQRIGTTGYIYCIDSQGNAAYHPKKDVQGSSLVAFPFIQEQIVNKQGYLEYEWQNPDEPHARAKALYMVYFEPLDWIISISTYRDEFMSLVNLDDIRANVQSLRFGRSGYAFITDRNGELLIHPRSGHAKNIAEVTQGASAFMDQIVAMQSGSLLYDFKDPVSKKVERKIAYFDYIADFGWYVGTSHFTDDVFKPLRTIRSIIWLTSLAIFIMAIAVVTWFSSYANAHIERLIAEFEKGAGGFFKARLHTHAKDEFGKLAHCFNIFMERLESYQRTLLEEIDKRRDVQNAAYASEQRIKSLVRNAPVLLWAIDPKGLLTFYEGNLRVPLDACDCARLGQPLTQVWPQWALLTEHLGRALAGQSGSLLLAQEEYAIEIHYNALLGLDRTVEGAVGVTIDVTSRWQAERKFDAAEQERQKLVMAVEQAAEIIVITDRAGIIEYVNPAFERSSGYSKAEAIGQKPSVLKSGKHDKQFYARLWKTISAGKVWSGRFINKKKDGSLYYEEATIAPLRDDSDRIVHYVASKRDVTSEIALERQLLHSERMKAIGTLAGGIAHDFNNILSGIMGYTELCLNETPKGSPLYQRLEKVLQAGLRAKELIGHIQTFSRQASVEPITMLPAPLVNEAMKLIRASFPVIIAFKSDIQNVGAIRAVPAQIHQIVMNLCTNACHAMKQGGLLSVALRRQVIDTESAKHLWDIPAGEYARLSVSDTGHGIPADIIGKIFDPYFTTKAEGEGSGLGLAVVHGIVKHMGGAITVSSVAGEGTTFSVYLPLLANPEEIRNRPDGSVPTGNGQSILLVDDEAYVLESTQEMLEGLGYQVTACSDAVDALNCFKARPQHFDMVITDYSLPRMDGAQLAMTLKQLRPNVPLIVSTGFSNDDRLAALEKQGIADRLNKPIIRSELAAKVSTALDFSNPRA